jgi:hypothetical protein
LNKQAGTTGNVCCIVRGEDGESPARALKDYERQRFQRSGIDAFLLSTPFHLGKLSFIDLWHDNTGHDPSWYVNKVTIRDVFKDQMYYFMCNRWLAVEHDDGQVSRTLPVAKKDEIQAFGHLFSSVSRRNVTDRHLWLSVFTKPAKSRFTRIQRASCCLAVVYCIMLCNTIFYLTGSDSDPSSTIQAGPLRFSSHQVYIGIASCMIILPANLIIVGIFRSVRDKRQGTDKKDKSNEAPLIVGHQDLTSLLNWYKIAGQSETSLYGKDSFSKIAPEKNIISNKTMAGKVNVSELRKNFDNSLSSFSIRIGINEQLGQALQKKQRKDVISLPHYFVYLGWFYFITLSSVSAYFIVVYGAQFSEEKASQWLTSVIISLLFDIVIFHCVKVLVIALYFALVLKQTDEDDFGTTNETSNEKPMEFTEYDKMIYNPAVTQPPSGEELEKARFQKLRVIQMNVIIKDMVVYVFFLASLLVVSYSHRDPQAFAVAQNMMDTFIGGTFVGNSLTEVRLLYQ